MATRGSIEDAGAWDTNWSKRVSSLQFLRLIETSGEIGFWSFDFENGDLTASPGFHWIHGSTPQTFVTAMDFVKFVHPDDVPLLARHHEQIISGSAPSREFRVIRPDGSMRWVELKNDVVLGPENRPVRVIGTVTDLTKRHHALAALAQSEDRFDALVALVAEVVWSISSLGFMVDSAGWEALTGQSRSGASAGGWLDAIDPDDRARVAALWQQAQETHTTFATDLRIRCGDRTVRHFAAQLVPLDNPDGTLREWVGILRALNPAEGPGNGLGERRALPLALSVFGAKGFLTGSEIRGARGLLNWSIPDLAKAAGVSISTIKRLEVEPPESLRSLKTGIVRKALDNAGVDFFTLPDGRSAQALRRLPGDAGSDPS